MKFATLFSGVAGPEIAASELGWETVFTCEINPFCQTILKYYFPYATHHSDIKQTDFTIYRGTIDVLCGGFPCQPFSVAGKRQGTADDRNLWPEMLRAVREIQPRWVVGENVRGLISWNAGLVFEQVQADLEAEGYEILPFLLPACAVGAPHRRERVFFIAHSNRDRQRRYNSAPQRFESNRNGLPCNDVKPLCSDGLITDTINTRLQRSKSRRSFKERDGKETFRPVTKLHEVYSWGNWPTQSPVCGRNDGFSPELDGITVSKHRTESLKAYGNAIVPAQILPYFKAINQYEQLQLTQ
jgi:DNA (cytosine-5)-methyltransferase 1